MFAEMMSAPAYRAYRLRLEASLRIPTDTTEQETHEIIAARFGSTRVNNWCEQSNFSADALSQVIPMSTVRHRLARGQRFTLGESDRLFRRAHVTAMAEMVFGNKEKAQRWLCKPKQRFADTLPITLLSTCQGARVIEELLTELADGLAF